MPLYDIETEISFPDTDEFAKEYRGRDAVVGVNIRGFFCVQINGYFDSNKNILVSSVNKNHQPLPINEAVHAAKTFRSIYEAVSKATDIF